MAFIVRIVKRVLCAFQQTSPRQSDIVLFFIHPENMLAVSVHHIASESYEQPLESCNLCICQADNQCMGYVDTIAECCTKNGSFAFMSL